MPTFIPVGADPIDIQDIKVKGDDLGYGEVQMWTINADAETDLNFVWLPESMVNPEDYPGLEEAGWFDEGNWFAADKTFEEGEAYMLNNGKGAGVEITYAGEVFDGATLVPVSENNYSLSGNMTPVAFDIQRFVVKGDDLGYGEVQMWTINADAETDLNFVWLPESMVNPEDYPGLEEAGWFDEGNWFAAEHEFLAGDGFMMNNGKGAGVSLKMPNPME